MTETIESTDPSKLIMRVLMTPDKANFSGRVHGGEIMKMMDHVAYVCAARYTGLYCVTISVDRVVFKNPIPVGSLVTFLASVNHTGKSSMEIGIKVLSEDIKTREFVHTNSSYFSMVAVDANGKPTPVPQLPVNTDEEKRRFANAEVRKQLRLSESEKIVKAKA